MMPRKWFAAAAALALLLSGCGVRENYRALEQTRLVQTLGCDLGEGEARLSAAAGSGADGPILLCRSGSGILTAMDSLRDYMPQGQLFFAHVQYLLLGRETVERGIGPLLDFAERDVQMRLDTELFALREGEAGVLILDSGQRDITEMLSSAKRETERRGAGHVTTLRETALDLNESGAALICALRRADSEGSVGPASEESALVPDGCVILRDGRLAGTLDLREAETAGLLLGWPGMVTRRLAGSPVTLQLTGKGRLKPRGTDGGAPVLEVSVQVRAMVAEAEDGEPEAPALLAERLRRELERDLSELLELSKRLDADFLGLGSALRRSGQSALAPDWLARLVYTLRVEADVEGSYDLSLQTKEAGR